ncbi:hypothetical protein, partial [Allokutzneria sp. NRRL B-24872]|uniref:hypothetical protein n=1 Tax=Allokutzneria sp. NRRL B-24872 TaxID=1137961 RepID=UPI001178A465
MDAEVVAALAAANLEVHQVLPWFEVLAEAYEQSPGDWHEFLARLLAGTDGELAAPTAAFTAHADANGQLDLVRRMVETDPAELQEIVTAETGLRLWHMVVAQFGPGWAGWDGSEEGWGQFRDWVYIGANEQDPRMYAETYQRLEPRGASPLTERIEALRALGFTVTGVQAAEAS